MTRKEPQTGEIWKHFKGNLYLILTTATHSETRESYVVYKHFMEIIRTIYVLFRCLWSLWTIKNTRQRHRNSGLKNINDRNVPWS